MLRNCNIQERFEHYLERIEEWHIKKYKEWQEHPDYFYYDIFSASGLVLVVIGILQWVLGLLTG
jgi:hypothetical protein